VLQIEETGRGGEKELFFPENLLLSFSPVSPLDPTFDGAAGCRPAFVGTSVQADVP
jgi:hypothetical protein